MVSPDPFLRIMLPSVKFNDHLRRRTVKIDDVIPNIFLSVELATFQLFSSDSLPKEAFGFSHVLSELSGKCLEFLIER